MEVQFSIILSTISTDVRTQARIVPPVLDDQPQAGGLGSHQVPLWMFGFLSFTIAVTVKPLAGNERFAGQSISRSSEDHCLGYRTSPNRYAARGA
jgi:hypothetical protein